MTTYSKNETIRAREEQVCHICGGVINPGEYYHRINIGRRGNFKICQRRHPIKVKAEAVMSEE